MHTQILNNENIADLGDHCVWKTQILETLETSAFGKRKYWRPWRHLRLENANIGDLGDRMTQIEQYQIYRTGPGPRKITMRNLSSLTGDDKLLP